jgi:hypothetical protein
MSLILSMQHALLVNPEASALAEEDADAEEDDS